MKKIFIVGILFLLWTAVHAQDALPFLRIDRDPATAAMGGIQAVSDLQNPVWFPSAEAILFSAIRTGRRKPSIPPT